MEDMKTSKSENTNNSQSAVNNSKNNNTEMDTNKKDNNRASSNRDSGRRDSGRRDRDRSRRRSRSPYRSREERPGSIKTHKRVYVANIPFDVRWGELKDFFRDKVGNVRFCQLFENEEGKPRGCGLVEFEDVASAQKAIEILNRFNFRGRELVVKEDLDVERDRYGRLLLNSRRERRDDDRGNYDNYPRYERSHYEDSHSYPPNGSDSNSSGSFNTYGLSPQFLSSLGISGPLNNRIFVANLDYKVSERKLDDIFQLAGKITKVKLYTDSDGKSKGFGVVEFSHPVEAVQAISMFNNQKLYDRILSVRLDKFDNDEPIGGDGLPSKLPTGLEGIGKGLGIGGQPLNISQRVLSNQLSSIPPAVNSVVPPVGGANVVPTQAATAAINALTNLASLPNLAQSLAQLTSTTNLSAPLANSALPPAGYSASPATEIPPSAAPTPTYSGYSTVAPPNNGTVPQPAPYTTHQQQLPPVAGYGPPPQTAPPTASYGGGSAHTGGTVLSSYSTYDQRDYRDEKYRSTGIDTIFIRNLPLTFSWQNLRDRFSEFGEVRFAEMKGHGTAVVRFSSDRDAQRACDHMNGLRIENRAIEVSLYY